MAPLLSIRPHTLARKSGPQCWATTGSFSSLLSESFPRWNISPRFKAALVIISLSFPLINSISRLTSIFFLPLFYYCHSLSFLIYKWEIQEKLLSLPTILNMRFLFLCYKSGLWESSNMNSKGSQKRGPVLKYKLGILALKSSYFIRLCYCRYRW